MIRLSGVDLPQDKRIDIALTYLYGIGRVNVGPLLTLAKIDPASLDFLRLKIFAAPLANFPNLKK